VPGWSPSNRGEVIGARVLELEAAAYLLAARLALRVVSFPRLARSFSRTAKRPEVEGPPRDSARADIRRAVLFASRRLPGTVCFTQAIAAQAMLRRRGISTTLVCGAARNRSAGLRAHVWLLDRAGPVIGCRNSHEFVELARYP
jgi:hypothetical protein